MNVSPKKAGEQVHLLDLEFERQAKVQQEKIHDLIRRNSKRSQPTIRILDASKEYEQLSSPMAMAPSDSIAFNAAMLFRSQLSIKRLRDLSSFIAEHPDSWLNVFLLTWYRTEIGRSNVNRLSRLLPEEKRRSELYHQLDLTLKNR